MKIRRILALAIICAMVLPLVGITTASAAEVPDVSGLKETAITFPASGGISSTDQTGKGDNFNGYIHSGQGADFLAAKYLKITYTVTGDVDENVDLFTFQPFDSGWQGWQNNFVTLADSVKDGDSYTAYVSVDDVKASLGEGVSAMGINISFTEPPAGVVVKLTGYSALTEPSGLPETIRGWLEYSINYSKALDASKYQEESFKNFQSAITTAEGVLNNPSASDSQLQTARDNLEKVKAKLLFKDSTEQGKPQPFRVISGEDTVKEMGVGWNLGNTMDGHAGFHPSETSWQPYTTTKEMICALHDAGFNTIRIPVTWGDMIDDNNNYAINDGWISRVQDIVDYCVEQDMYAIINIHHDGAEQDGWLRVASDNIDFVYEKYEGVWRNIAERFKDYDEHLIFESANELTCMAGDNKNSSAAQAKDTPIIMNLNQIFVNTVRATGSNNSRRWLAAVTHYASRGTSNGFALPTDSYNSENRLMFAQHIYKDTSKETYVWDMSNPPENTGRANETVKVIKEAHNKFKNIPIILGEYGYRNKSYSGNPSGYNDIGRAYVYECATRAGQVGMTVPVAWDDSRGSGQPLFETGVYTVWDREGGKPVFKSITDAMMRGMFLTPSSKNKSFDMSDIVLGPEIIPITEIIPSESEVNIEVGSSAKLTVSVQPSNTNDVVLWKSDDDNIATVYNGLVQGSRIGATYVTAFSQSGSAMARVRVIVSAIESNNPAADIVSQNSYNVTQGKYMFLDAKADNGENLLYYSSNEKVATVSAEGKVVGIAPGAAYITIAAETGYTKTVPVIVSEPAGDKKVNVAANVYYNKGYFGTERGKPVAINGDGQYTVSFDLDADISDAGKKAGIKAIENFGSLYIKDYDVDMGNASKSPIDGCEIRYDEIKVNGIPLNITDKEFKSAMNGAVLDTGDPFNAWEGSVVGGDEITTDTKNYLVNFKNIENPTKIEITFTIQNLAFTQAEEGRPATSISSDLSGEITLSEGSEMEIPVSVEPADTTSLVSFVSGNRGVLITDTRGAAVKDGKASGKIYGAKPGDTVLTAITDSGQMLSLVVHIASNPFKNIAPVVIDGRITAVTADVNKVPDIDSVTVIAAAYNADGALSGADTKAVPISEIRTGAASFDGFDIVVPEGGSAKAFIWSGTDAIAPLGK